MTSFGARLSDRVATRESQIVIGLDPDPMELWPGSWDDLEPSLSRRSRAAAAVSAHCAAVIAAVEPAVVGVKLQVACFERLGSPGWQALADVAGIARERGLIVIADGKRGDIDVSAGAYADGLLGRTRTPEGEVPGLGADAITVSPYMGSDTVAPFVQVARASGAGVFVLVRTSNPGAVDLEEAPLSAGGPVWERAAAIVGRFARPEGADGDVDDVGAVIGATAPSQLERARELLPRAPFLLPGVGAQGGAIADLGPAYAPGRAGGLVTVSRAIAGAGPDGARAAAEDFRAQAWALPAG